MRNLPLLVLAVSSALCAQPAWKEFSIGPGVPGRNQSGPFGIHASGMTLLRILSRAYGLPEHRIVGPSWLGTEKYALTAEVADAKDLQPLLQQELAKRLQLLAHREQRQVPVFVLKALDTPAKLSSSRPDSSTSMQGGARPVLQISGGTLNDFAGALADLIRRPVFNETGIDGAFQIRLAWQSGKLASLPGAIQDQLGLQLIDENRVVDLLIIDHIEKLPPQ